MRERISHGMRQVLVAALSLCFGSCQDASLAEPQAEAAPQVTSPKIEDIKVVMLTGSGCPPGTSRLFAYDDGFHLTFDAFELSTAQGTPGTASALCTLSARLPGVAGWSYSVGRVGVSGGASLSSDGSLSLSVDYGFAGAAASANATRYTLQGEHIGRFRTQGEVVEHVWAACGASSELVMKIPASQRSKEPALSHISSLTVELTARRCTALVAE